ncbi:hypothetical protein [Moorena producens]|nr:hypothetical protein [Moorena producens]
MVIWKWYIVSNLDNCPHLGYPDKIFLLCSLLPAPYSRSTQNESTSPN